MRIPEKMNTAARSFLEQICLADADKPVYIPVLIVAAHPDDEVIGLGSRMPFIKNIRIIHTTDGAPNNLLDARTHGFSDAHKYRLARREELKSALRYADIKEDALIEAGFPDQETAFYLTDLIEFISFKIRELKPGIVITHSYEGGHPDHDSTSLAVHAALRILGIRAPYAPTILEFSSYHSNMNGGISVMNFLPHKSTTVREIYLTPLQAALKLKMLNCFVSQKAVLDIFPFDREVYRTAPFYNFAAPPHKGKLYYENFRWGVESGSQWRMLALSALGNYGLAPHL